MMHMRTSSIRHLNRTLLLPETLFLFLKLGSLGYNLIGLVGQPLKRYGCLIGVKPRTNTEIERNTQFFIDLKLLLNGVKAALV
jgi:hypothetical protein